ncbi:MAG: homocysteine S-methyltransferase family protein [Lachnospiraceae bacterium]|nr:homocysteine S-methyltransferase family protein [Lachnospiraceae bacterium]
MNILEKMQEGFTWFDGGCGTILQAAGLQPGELPERWNMSHADVIRGMHFDYLLAGVNILKTNTFGANCMKFSEEGELETIIRAAIGNARAAVAAAESGQEIAGRSGSDFSRVAKEHYVALDVGPLGKLLKPLGDLDFEDAYRTFLRTVEIGTAEGADLILIETMNDIYEAKAAVLAAKESGLPVFLTTAYDESAKLLTGADPRSVVAVAEGLGVDAVGVNCSLGPEEMMGIVDELAAYASVPVIVNPNAGLPRTEGGRTVYDVTPDLFAKSMIKIASKGARVLGGCCGTTPAHIGAMITEVKKMTPLPLSEKEYSLITSYTHAVEFGKKPILIGERINPTGKKRFKEALRAHDMDYILQQGLLQQDQHADVLDVNVGLPEIDEAGMMEEVVGELQAVCDLPLQIDTTDPVAMERALRRYNGKPMINSVNGKAEVMEQVFPLAKKYGGLIVALTIDEEGIPATAEGRVAIAERIYAKAAEYGIKRKDLIIDPLAMSISAEAESAKVTLEALRLIREKLGGLTSLGVSNISFGLPKRDLVNAAFFTMAMQNGLSAAIMNPASMEMMKSYYGFCALQALDENCTDYIAFTETYEESLPAAAAAGDAGKKTAPAAGAAYDAIEDKSLIPLVESIVKGLKDRAGAITKEMLEAGRSSMDLIDGALIPALDIVGKGFEEKRVFLPQLLMSADAAGGAFDEIRARMRDSGAEQEIKGRMILATVKGDIHDIGKNIVKVLLENYGFEVIDLGKDVPPELIVETAKKENIRLVGLSALMTTTVPAMEETIRQLNAELPDCRTVVGGAVMTPEYAGMIHADRYCKDAMETVRFAEQFFAQEGK